MNTSRAYIDGNPTVYYFWDFYFFKENYVFLWLFELSLQGLEGGVFYKIVVKFNI